MPSVADALRVHPPAIWQTLSIAEQKVLSCIIRCRTGALGGVHYQCSGCGREHWVGRSCGNRHCPSCGHEKTQLRIEKQFAKPTLKYLVPYVHQVALSDKRIAAVDESSVTYRVRPSKSVQKVTRRVDGESFVRSFAQHVLPPGFQKIRHYGWMSANSKLPLAEVKWLVWLPLAWIFWLASGHAPQEKPLTTPLRCSDCGDELRVVDVTHGPITCSDERALGYFDSG